MYAGHAEDVAPAWADPGNETWQPALVHGESETAHKDKERAMSGEARPVQAGGQAGPTILLCIRASGV